MLKKLLGRAVAGHSSPTVRPRPSGAGFAYHGGFDHHEA
jgi:hypothetical protein